ncbi:MAG: helix-turn-helix domain-containing protein [Clostridiales bacterium]|jgi:putative transposase|nr:helix-turn-helix domain-containing protein [Clostridiales bacterium]MDR2751500.1 helix-turn-helix domain-containing protein [Clostridiales bacterium]
MAKFEEAPEKIKELEDILQDTKDKRLYAKLLALLEVLSGATARDAAGTSCLSVREVYYVIDRYKREGASGLKDKPRSGRPKKVSTAD